MNIEIPYTPRNWATPLHETIKRWIVMVLHRRAGKTTAILNHLQRDALTHNDANYAFVATTYTQVKLIAWDIAKQMSSTIPGVKYLETAPYTIKYPNGSKLYLLGSDNPDALRGMKLWGGGQDESSQQPSNLFTEVISKCLADQLGYWIWAGTPKGKNEFHKTYKIGLANPKDYQVIFKTIDDSLRDESGETIENLRQALEDDRRLVEQGLMTQDEFDQEWYCSFEAAIKGAYYAKQLAEARAKGRIGFVGYDGALPVHIVVDLGVGQALAAGFYQRVAGQVKMIDYWEGTEKEAIPDLVKACQAKRYVYGKMFVPHDAKGTDQGTGKTRLATLKQLWPRIEIIVAPKLAVDDGIAKGKLMFNRLHIDERNCSIFLDHIAQYHQEWDANRGMFLEKPYHDFTSHSADVHRYASIMEKEMVSDAYKINYQPEHTAVSEYEGG